jgi:hypothetical protein
MWLYFSVRSEFTHSDIHVTETLFGLWLCMLVCRGVLVKKYWTQNKSEQRVAIEMYCNWSNRSGVVISSDGELL